MVTTTSSLRRFVSMLALTGFVCAASLASAQDVPGAEGKATLSVDKKKSKIEFISTAPAEKIVGTVEGAIDGKLAMNLDNLAETKGKISFPVVSMNTGNKMRDKHLAGKDWLNADKNPTVVYEVTGLKGLKITEDSDKKVVMTGTSDGKVTVNGVTVDRPAKISITIAKAAKNGARLVKVEPTFEVALSDHKVVGNRGSIGSKVGKTIQVSGLIYGMASK